MLNIYAVKTGSDFVTSSDYSSVHAIPNSLRTPRVDSKSCAFASRIRRIRVNERRILKERSCRFKSIRISVDGALVALQSDISPFYIQENAS